MQMRVVRLREGAYLPTRAHSTDAGLDLRAAENLTVEPGGFAVTDIGVGVELPVGCYGQILARSSFAIQGLFAIGGVIDQGYRGSIKVALVNASKIPAHILKGDKIAQLVIIRIETPEPVEVLFLDQTDRGTKGFGSSGR